MSPYIVSELRNDNAELKDFVAYQIVIGNKLVTWV